MDEKIITLIRSSETDIRVGAWPLPNGQVEGTLDLYQDGKLVASLLTHGSRVFGSKEEAVAVMNLVLHKIKQMPIEEGGT